LHDGPTTLKILLASSKNGKRSKSQVLGELEIKMAHQYFLSNPQKIQQVFRSLGFEKLVANEKLEEIP
jgi:hypothetical protein